MGQTNGLSKKFWLLTIVGTSLLLIGVLSYLLFPTILANRVGKEVTLTQGSQIYDKWVETPIAIDFNVYIFEVTNTEEVLRGGKPVVKEVGPFAFVEKRRKKIIKYSENKETVQYEEYKTYWFNRNKSVDSLKRKVTVINVPMIAIVSQITTYLKQLPLQPITRPLVLIFINALLDVHRQNLFTTRTAEELIFKGYRINVLDTLTVLTRPLRLVGINIPVSPLADNTFGLFHNRNNTMEGLLEVYTGVSNPERLAQIVSWKNQRTLKYWHDSTCNMINGTDGTQFPTFMEKYGTLKVFSTEICRSITMGFEKETQVKGVPAYRFSPHPSMFASPSSYPENWCFCSTPTELDKCEDDGLIDISACWFGAPLYVSNPHFMQTARSISGQVRGLKPDSEKHSTFLDVQPVTGTTLRAIKRSQINVKLKKLPFVMSMHNLLPQSFVPFAWIEEHGELDEVLKEEIQSKLLTLLNIASIGIHGLMLVGALMCALALALFLCRRRKTYDPPLPRGTQPKMKAGNEKKGFDKLFDPSSYNCFRAKTNYENRSESQSDLVREEHTPQRFPIRRESLHNNFVSTRNLRGYGATSKTASLNLPTSPPSQWKPGPSKPRKPLSKQRSKVLSLQTVPNQQQILNVSTLSDDYGHR